MPYADTDKQRKFQREWIASRRAEYLKDKACELCERKTDDLNVHHRDPSQKQSHSIWTWAPERLRAELAKCEVLCERCHVRLHQRVRFLLACKLNPCGTVAAYKRGCKCADCRAANAARQRERLAA